MFGIMFPVSYFCWMKGYDSGKDGIEKLLSGNQLQQIIMGASAMGAIVLGALSAQFVAVSTPVVIKIGAVQLGLQADVFDKLFVGILPLTVTLLTLFLLKNKQLKATTVMAILVGVGVVTGILGLL
jgi:PTS system mannose-specific IID component